MLPAVSLMESESSDDPSPSETLLGESEQLHRLSSERILALFEEHDRVTIAAVAAAGGETIELAQRMSRVLAGGGRIIYVGAGTSGRLGALDAAEWPPTFEAK